MIVVDASVLVHALTNREDLGKKAKERLGGAATVRSRRRQP